MTRAAAGVLAMLAAPALLGAGGAPQAGNPAEAWRTFAGSWSARGPRQVLPTEGGRSAAIVRLSGAVVLAKKDLGGGLLGEAITFARGSDLQRAEG